MFLCMFLYTKKRRDREEVRRRWPEKCREVGRREKQNIIRQELVLAVKQVHVHIVAKLGN